MTILENEKISKILLIFILMLALILGCVGKNTANNSNIELMGANNEIKGTIWVDTLITNKTYYQNDIIQFSGWKMCTQEDSKIKVTIDGKENVIQTDIIYVQRPDVIQAIKGYGTEKENPTPGYFVKIKASNLTQGKHIIKAIVVTKDNKELDSYQETVTIDKRIRGVIHVDTPIANKTYYQNDIIEFSGWKMCMQEDSKIKVTIDGKENVVKEDITYVQRPDVIQAIKGYGTEKENPTPGYFVKIKASDLAQGKHTIKATVISKNNEELDSYEKVVTIDKGIRGALQVDTAIVNKTYYLNDIIEFSGWKMCTQEDSKIKITIDGKENVVKEDITYVKRPDVIQIIKGYGTEKENPNPGYFIKIKASDLAQGKHTIKATVISKNNDELASYQETVTIDKRIKGTLWVDTPIANKIYYINDIIEFSGWKMCVQEDSRIKVTIDGKENVVKEDIMYVQRPDVIQAIKGHGTEKENPNPGYFVKIKASDLTQGKHTIKATLVTKDNKEIESYQQTVTVDKRIRGTLWVDTPIVNKTYYQNDIIQFSGWKMCTQEDSKIKVTIDGKENVIQTDIIYVQRPDVIQAIKGYGTEKENPNPGYFIKIKASELAQGKHTIKATLVTKDNKEIESYQETVTIDKNNVHIEYSTYLEGIGWQDYKKDGQTAGTQDRNLKIEAIKISGKNLPENVAIVYQAYIQGKGWQEIKNDNEIAGTEGKDLRVEGIKIEINNTEEYSIMYRTKVQNIGWQEWCYDGETSGTIGNNAQIEAIEIKIDDKYTEIKNSICIDWPKNVIENKKQRIHGWVMTNVKNSRTKVFIDNIEIENIKRIDRQDVLNVIKGYGNEIILNAKPGFETEIDFSKYSLGYHTIKVQIVSEDGKILLEQSNNFKVEKPITIQTGTYGISGLKVKGDPRGSDLKYYRFGDGPNVFFATYAIHGYEDLWDRDGYELVDMAEQLYAHLVNSHDNQIADKWTIYIFPGVNQDGLKYGSTNNGPGRTTLFSQAPGNKGIDLNRCWQVGNNYTIFKDNRNYNGTAGFQAYEAQYLRDFLLSHKSKNGQTMLVDLHGWTQQLIGDPDICSYYEKQFSENDKSAVGRYGDGYLINWARNSLGSNSKPAKTALIELPHQGINGHQSVIANNLPTRYLNATLDLLKNINI